MLETIVEHLRGVQANLDIIRGNRYEDKNELVAYMNDIQFSLHETLGQPESIRRNHRRLNGNLHDLEARVKHIEFHMHERYGFPIVPPRLPPHILSDMMFSGSLPFFPLFFYVWLVSLLTIMVV